MPDNKYQSCTTLVEKFNNDYQVQFSLSDFESRLLKLKNVSRNLNVHTDIAPEDIIYRSFLQNLYRQCIENYMDKRLPDIDHPNLVKDFEALIAEYRKINNVTKPSRWGKYPSNYAIIDALRETANSVTPDKAELLENKYKAGNTSLAKMREQLLDIRNAGEDMTAVQLSRAIVMTRALQRIVGSRSGLWKFFHPIRSRAEQRDLRDARAFLIEQKQNNENLYNEAETIADDQTAVTHANANLDRSIDRIKQHEAEKKAQNEKIDNGNPDLHAAPNNILDDEKRIHLNLSEEFQPNEEKENNVIGEDENVPKSNVSVK